MISNPSHVPVLLRESLEWLDPQPGGRFVDLTLGCGGHARGLLEAVGPDGFVFGMDRDRELLDETLEQMRAEGYGPDRFEAAGGPFADIDAHLGAADLLGYDGFLADLGASSVHFDQPGRGFSFRQAGPLDMRFDRSGGPTLAEVLRDLDEDGLRRLLAEYGEERRARSISRAILRARDAGGLNDTAELAEVVRRAFPPKARYGARIDPATRTFQALRIAVNDELGVMREGLVKVVNAMRPGARLAVISFHSLEDRIVKRLFQSISEGEKDFYGHRSQAGARRLSRKSVTAREDEVTENPRSRSARLRVIEKLGQGAIAT